MEVFTISLEDKDLNYNVLKLKAGNVVKTPAGDIETECVLGVKDFSIIVINYELNATIILGGWKTNARYESNLKSEAYTDPYFSYVLQFNERSIPPAFFSFVKFNKKFLFGVEFTESFMNEILKLPDGSGGIFADRWEIL
jgi:hypothetical protein